MKMCKILVFGDTGMLGRAVIEEIKRHNIDVVGISRTGKDISLDISDTNKLRSIIDKVNPDIIINCAAIVDIDSCEQNPCLAYLVNSRVVGIIAEIAKKKNIYFIQISTDHFFTGDKDKKHGESDNVVLINEYSKTKLIGEVFALQYSKSLVIRTNIVGFRDNKEKYTFVEWIINALINSEPITLFTDYYVSSISVRQLSKVLIDLIKIRQNGILNIACREVYSKKEFIESIAKEFRLPLNKHTVGSSESFFRVKRCESLGLDVQKAEKLLGYHLPTKDEVIRELSTEYKDKFK